LCEGTSPDEERWMNSLMVFEIVFGGVGFSIFLFFLIKTVIQPKKFLAIERLIEGGNSRSAIRHVKALLARNERSIDAHWFLGECYRSEDRPDLSIVEYRYITNNGRYTQTATENKVRIRLAEGYVKLGQYDEAQKEYILLSKIEPGNYELFYRIADLFEQRNYVDSALTNFKKVIDLNPRHALSHHRIGVIQCKKQLLNEARQSLLMALRLDPKNYGTYYYLGRISRMSGDSAAAISQFEKAVRDPDLKSKALYEKASLLLVNGEYDRAVTDLERALTTADSDSSIVFAIRYQLGRCYEIKKDLLKAVEQWELIYRKNPKYRDVAEKLTVYSSLRVDDALKDFLTAPQQKFKEYCTRVAQSLGLAVQDVLLKNQDLVEMLALETQSKWRNAKMTPNVIRVFRGVEPISYDAIRGLYDNMRRANATRSICITASRFTKTAIEFAQIRPIDLIDQHELSRILHKLSS
jgi:tetratricopeptide (TPR) repeat protein